MDNSYKKLENGGTNLKTKNNHGNNAVVEEPQGWTVDNSRTMGDINLDQNQMNRRVRLRAVETEKEFFFKLLNVTSIRRLIHVQVIFTATIVICQILLYAILTTGYYKAVDLTGIGLWAPLMFFGVAAGLSYLAIKSPTGCLLGTAMGFQIASSVIASVLTLLAAISLGMHGRRYWGDQDYDPEIPGRVICSIMILSSILVVFTSFFISIQFCRATCCGRSKATESVLFDLETVKI